MVPQIRFLPKNQKYKKQKIFKLNKIKILNLNQISKSKNENDKEQRFRSFDISKLTSKLLQRKPKQEQLTISKTKILTSKI